MSRSVKRGRLSNNDIDPNDITVTSYYAKESGITRKIQRRKNRRVASELVVTMCDPDELNIPPIKGTQGWITH